MDFELSDGDRAFERDVIKWVESYIRPNLGDWHEKGALPREFWEQLGRRGWLLVEHGSGGDFRERPMLQLATMYDRISEASPGAGIAVFADNQLGLWSILTFGTREQQGRFLGPASTGEHVISFGNTEPTAGSDVAAITTRAVPDGDGWRLTGKKMFITNAVEADHHVVSAVTDPHATDPHKGMSLFIVDGDAPGLSRRALKKIVWSPASLAFLSLEDVRVGPDRLLGELNGGFKEIMRVFTAGRIGVASMTMGTAVGALRLAHRRARSRRVFGSTIWDQPSKRDEFADMATLVEAGRLLYRKAAWLKDTGQDYKMAASLAKLFATENARRVTQWAALLHGGSSVLAENPIHRYPLDAWASALGEGVEEVQRLIISRHFDEWIERF
jgi:alkylation response protein AidB-like acyl-CoA dehydrogenase